MKKQILILTFFIAAILAGTNANGQTYDQSLTAALDTCLTPEILTCLEDSALAPAPGVEYTYYISSEDYADPGNDAEKVHWFVINYNDFISANDSLIRAIGDTTHLDGYIDPGDGSGDYLLTSNPAVYNVYTTVGQTSDSITLSWQYFDGLTNQVLLVAYVESADGCTNNIEAYRIMPAPAFTLDIAPLSSSGVIIDTSIGRAEECVSPIESASYTAGATPGAGTLTVDYGENWLYFVVNGANFVDSWLPSFQFAYTGIDGLSDVASAAWTYPDASGSTTASVWHDIDVNTGVTSVPVIGGGGAADGTPLNAQGDGTAVGADGECIVVRVQIDHGTNSENVVERMLSVAVNGTMFNPAAATAADYYTNTTLDDFGPDSNSDGSCDQTDFDDSTDFYLTPRPDVNEVDPIPFEQKTGEDN